jgi:hypothetical protein
MVTRVTQPNEGDWKKLVKMISLKHFPKVNSEYLNYLCE